MNRSADPSLINAIHCLCAHLFHGSSPFCAGVVYLMIQLSQESKSEPMINVPVMCCLSNRLVCVCWILYGQTAGFRLFSDFEDLVGKNGVIFRLNLKK